MKLKKDLKNNQSTMNQSIINKLFYIIMGILISIIGVLIFYFFQQKNEVTVSKTNLSKPLSSENNIQKSNKVEKEKITSGKFTAYVECTSQVNGGKLILKGNDKEIFTTFTDTGCDYLPADINFSPLNNYLIYTDYKGGSKSFIFIYDINKKKELNPMLVAINWRGFSKNEDYFIACAYTELDMIQYGGIYKMPNFTVKYDVFKDKKMASSQSDFVESINCQYDENKNSARFDLKESFFDKNNKINYKTRSVEYNLSNDEIIYF